MSSSNRRVPLCDGVLVVGDRRRGPMRLPENRASDFVDHFNRTYQTLGLSIAPVEVPPAINETPATNETPAINEKTPASQERDTGGQFVVGLG